MNACAHAAVPKASRPRTFPRRPEQAVGEGRIYNKERKTFISTFFEIQFYVISMNFEIMKSARHSAPVPPRPSPARRPFGAIFSPRSIGIGQGRGARSFCRATLSAVRSASPSVGRCFRVRRSRKAPCAFASGRAAAEPADPRANHNAGENHIEENHTARGKVMLQMNGKMKAAAPIG